MSNLSSARVEEIFRECLHGAGTEATVEAEGVLHNVKFHASLLKVHKDEIMTMLLDLPETFRQSSGGGMSFLNACMDKEGRQWGEHRNMEQLFLLGIGIGRVKSLLPREVWPALPGGMPYYVVLDTEVPDMFTREDVEEGARRFRATREHDAHQEGTYPFYSYDSV